MPAQRDGFLHGIARCAGDVRDDHAVIAAQGVEQARFSDVRAAENGGAHAALQPPPARAGGQQRDECLPHVLKRFAEIFKLEGVNILVGIVENRVKMRADAAQRVVQRLNFAP